MLLLLMTLSTTGALADDTTDTTTVSFARALKQLESAVSWTGYGDLTAKWTPSEDVFTFDAAHFNPILGARLDDKLWAELELEFEHGGSEIKVEYGVLDFQANDALTLRMGQFLVPIGQFNEIDHPSFRWSQVSRPKMFRSVIPAVWSDVGIQAFGDVDIGPSASFGYNAYVINGLGPKDDDPANAFDAAADEPLRGLRSNRVDTNSDKAVGGQLRARVGRGAMVGDTTVRLSGYTGAISPGNTDRLVIVNGALDSRFGPLKLKGEAAHSIVEGEPLETGLYALLAAKAGMVTPSVRYDHLITGANRDTTQQVAASVMVAPYQQWNVRLELDQGLDDGWDPTVLGMSAFYF